MERDADLSLLLIELDAGQRRINEIIAALRARVEGLRGPEPDAGAARFRRYTSADWARRLEGGKA